MTFILTFAFITVIIKSGVVAKTKSVIAKGTVVCDGQPINDAEIELYDERYGVAPNSIAKTKTDANGQFTIKGSSKKTTFDPQFSISHGCRMKLCRRKVLLRIPSKYSTSGSEPRDIYDIGVVDMKTKFPTETKTCPT